MYAIIRRYSLKTAQNQKTVDDLKRRLDEGFLPKVQDVQGFHGYYAMNVGGKGLVTITVCDDKAGADESTRRAAEFVKNDPLKDQLGSPEIIEGDLLIAKEAAIGTR